MGRAIRHITQDSLKSVRRYPIWTGLMCLGGDTSRRQRVYIWDHDRYIAWSSGGGYWLDRGDDKDDEPRGASGSERKGSGNIPLGNEGHREDDSHNNNKCTNNSTMSSSKRESKYLYRLIFI